MGYVKTVVKTEIDEFLDKAIEEINNEKDLNENLKVRLLEFIYLFDKKISTDITNISVIDIKNMPPKNTYII